jgi:ribosomal 50S subunit-associated protein YjgA (DUF615 family)
MQTEFRVLAELGEKLENITKRTLMIDLVAEFLENLSPDEIGPATNMTLGHPFPKGDTQTLEISCARARRQTTNQNKPQKLHKIFQQNRRFGSNHKNHIRNNQD